ncbi:MAG: right-handed parallel beta-helix repeat-containing protein [Nitrospirota bacterium]
MALKRRVNKSHAHLFAWGLSILSLFSGALVSEAATYYVAPNGNDSVLCVNASNISTPKRTINSALDCPMPGDTLFIRAGTYAEAINSNQHTIPTGTSWSAPVTISGYPGETVTLNPSACEILNLPASYLQYIIFKDLVLDGINLVRNTGVGCYGISTQPSTHHLRFQNLEVKNSPWNGIIVAGSFHEFINLKVHDNGAWSMSTGYGPGNNGAYLTTDNSIVDGGEYYNNQCFGVRFMDSSAAQSSDNNVVRNTRIYGNGRGVAFSGTATCGSGGGGIVLGDANNAAYNNLIYSNYWGFQTTGSGTRPVSGALVYNNTFYANLYGINVSSESINAQVRNNILFQNGFGIANTGSGTFFSNNLCPAAALGCSLIGDPKFANAAGFDLRIQAGSPAIDAGTPLSLVGNDFARAARPQGPNYDIGAYEANGTTDTTAPVPPRNIQVIN